MKDSQIIIITWLGAMLCALVLVANLAANSAKIVGSYNTRDIPRDLTQALDGQHPATTLVPVVEVPTPPKPDKTELETERVDALLERMDNMNLLRRDVLELPHQPAAENTP